MVQEWVKDVKIEEVPEQYKGVAEAIGIEAYCKLCEAVGGSHYYVPMISNFLMEAKSNRIKKEYNGYNIKGLAYKYKVSESYARTLIEEKKIADGQCSIFDL